jgi:dihydropteroate synthase-like protein
MQTVIAIQPDHHYHFVTGKLARVAVHEIVAQLATANGFAYSIGVMPITVAALMTPRWLVRHLNMPPETTHLVVPGHCEFGWQEVANDVSIPVIVGPKDCRDMALLFGAQRSEIDLISYDIEIIAEINHATRQTVAEVSSQAARLAADGADVIDVGCDPASPCATIADYVQALVDQGHRVSIDSFDPSEVARAVRAGAELVLSVNSTNRVVAVDWGCEVVVVPDAPGSLEPHAVEQFQETIEFLDRNGVPLRIDPILEPIGSGFAASLLRYADIRRRYPEHRMMMGIGNLTELTDVDSAGVNFLLLGICQELGVRSVLTTQVINWARSAVRECDIARRLVHHSHHHGIPPKGLSTELVMLRDARLKSHSPAMLTSLAESIRDHNFRIFAQDDLIQLMSAGVRLNDADPFALFDQLLSSGAGQHIDPSHAFYLGFEMAKASIALLLGKQYEQDNALNWGHLTRDEKSHRLKR